MADLLQTESSISLYRGEARTLRLSVRDGAGLPVPLAGATVVFSVKRGIKDRAPILFKSTVDPTQIQVESASQGKVLLYLLASDTRYLDAGTYVYDIWLTLASGSRYVVIPPSDFVLTQSVTTFG